MEFLNKIIAKKRDVHGAPPITVAFFGDSVTQGCFELYKTAERGFQTEFSVADGYHTKFREILEMLYPSVPVNMIHAGISGDSATGGLKRVSRDVCAFSPDLTVFCFGLNDATKGISNLPNYEAAIEGIIKELRSSGSEIIFMTPNVMADELSPEITDSYVREVIGNMISTSDGALTAFIDAAKRICEREGVAVCDCYEVWQTLKKNEVDTTRLLSNRINHPIEKMHWLFATMLIKTIFER